MNEKLILRSQISPYGDITKGSVLSHADVDNNFINLKGQVIYTATSENGLVTFYKMNGDDFSVNVGASQDTYQTNVAVTASTPDNYTAIADPTISGYDTTVLYTVIFDQTNTTSATTIDIDGVGAVDLYVPTENGLEGPVPSGITTGVTYFMVYDGAGMQLFDTSPASSAFTYTNPAPVPTSIGGILAGMTFSGASLQYMFDTLLYPYLNPTFSSFSIAGQSTSLEVGNTVAGGARTFNWGMTYSGNIKPNTIKIKNINTNQIISTPASGMTNDGTEVISISSVTRTTAGSQTWTIYATTKKNVTISRNFSVTWYNRIYYGTSSLTALTANDITGLTSTNLASTSLGTFAYAAGDYKYFCIPTALNNPSLFRDKSTNLTVAMAGPSDGYTILNNGYYVQQVVVTNAYGINITYDVYRSKNQLGGAISIIAS